MSFSFFLFSDVRNVFSWGMGQEVSQFFFFSPHFWPWIRLQAYFISFALSGLQCFSLSNTNVQHFWDINSLLLFQWRLKGLQGDLCPSPPSWVLNIFYGLPRMHIFLNCINHLYGICCMSISASLLHVDRAGNPLCWVFCGLCMYMPLWVCKVFVCECVYLCMLALPSFSSSAR